MLLVFGLNALGKTTGISKMCSQVGWIQISDGIYLILNQFLFAFKSGPHGQVNERSIKRIPLFLLQRHRKSLLLHGHHFCIEVLAILVKASQFPDIRVVVDNERHVFVALVLLGQLLGAKVV